MDFKSVNFRAEATELWNIWLEEKANKEFKDHLKRVEKHFPGSNNKLLTHMLTPFNLMDEVSKSEDEWHFDSGSDINTYMYVSLLGSGFITSLVVLMIQILVPTLLLQAQITNPSGGHLRFNINETYNFTDPDGLYHDEWELFCSGDGSTVGRIMNIVVLLLYTVRILPDLLYNFFASSGEGETSKERLNSLRKVIWDTGDDTLWMQIGYKINKYANGFYVAILMTIMLFILFLTDDIFSIILNALALEFVHNLDEELATGDWFDPGARYISAGVTELVIRSILNLDAFKHWEKLCRNFDIATKDYRDAFEGKPTSLYDRKQATQDNINPKYLSKKRRFYHQALEMAMDPANDANRYHVQFRDIAPFDKEEAINNYKEGVDNFGIVDKILIGLGLEHRGIFNRYNDYAVWSRWQRVLFLPRVPTYDSGLDKYSDSNWNQTNQLASNFRGKKQGRLGRTHGSQGAKGGALRRWCLAIKHNIGACFSALSSVQMPWRTRQGHPPAKIYLNFSQKSSQSPTRRFLGELLSILMFTSVYRSIRVAIDRGQYHIIPFRLIDGLLDWLSYMYQIVFPFAILFFFYLAFFCY